MCLTSGPREGGEFPDARIAAACAPPSYARYVAGGVATSLALQLQSMTKLVAALAAWVSGKNAGWSRSRVEVGALLCMA